MPISCPLTVKPSRSRIPRLSSRAGWRRPRRFLPIVLLREADVVVLLGVVQVLLDGHLLLHQVGPVLGDVARLLVPGAGAAADALGTHLGLAGDRAFPLALLVLA